MRVIEAIELGRRVLPKTPGIPDPRREARWLLAHAWTVEETRLVSNPHEHVPEGVLARYRLWLERRAQGEPAHYLTGTCPFWGRRFTVSPDVLIPRPETELAVEAALGLDLPRHARILDVGTGTGCLAITLALERPTWRVIATELSGRALNMARHNAARLGASVRFVRCDLATAIGLSCDLITANLPYVPAHAMAHLPLEVQHEPRLALDGGDDGLALVRRLIRDLPCLLLPGGWAIFELGEGHASIVGRLAERTGLTVVRTIRDPGGCDRILILRRLSPGRVTDREP